MRIWIESKYGETEKELFGQHKTRLAPKAADITHKIKGKTKDSMCDNCQDFNKIKLWTNKSLKLHTVLYLKDVVVNFRSIIQIKDVYNAYVYLICTPNPSLMKKRT